VGTFYFLGFLVLTTVVIKSCVFFDIVPEENIASMFRVEE
jgi:hypothetical protein